MPILKSKSLILKCGDWRQTSKILVLFTQDYGKIKGVLKGVRKENLKYPSSQMLFSLNEILFYPSRNSDLNLISFIDCLRFFDFFSNLDKFWQACFFSYITDKITPLNQPNPQIFELLLWALSSLESFSGKELEFAFLVRILEYSGFKPRLFECLKCSQGISSLKEVFFDVKGGGLVCSACRDSSAFKIFPGALHSLLFFQTQNLNKVLSLRLNSATTEQIHLILRTFLVYHLELDPVLLES